MMLLMQLFLWSIVNSFFEFLIYKISSKNITTCGKILNTNDKGFKQKSFMRKGMFRDSCLLIVKN